MPVARGYPAGSRDRPGSRVTMTGHREHLGRKLATKRGNPDRATPTLLDLRHALMPRSRNPARSLRSIGTGAMFT